MLLPNTTQVPNVVFDIYLNSLKPTELKVLLIVIRQTLGWIQDETSKRRKERDWISTSQLQQKTGYSRKAISLAIDTLCQKKLIDVFDRRGNLCETPHLRRGKIRLYYRLQLITKGNTCSTEVGKDRHNFEKGNEETTHEEANLGHITKETLTKENCESNFKWESFLESLYESDQRHLNIIAYFFEKKKLCFDSYPKAVSAMKRHLRPARLLTPFSDSEIVEATKDLLNSFPPFTLETVYKQLTK